MSRKRLIEIGRLLRDELRACFAIAVVRVEHCRPRTSRAPALAGDRAGGSRASEELRTELAKLQRRLALLVRRKRFRKHALVLAFEGMDAAGKGGAIRRVDAGARRAAVPGRAGVRAERGRARSIPIYGASGATCPSAVRSRSMIARGTAACSSSACADSRRRADWQTCLR